MKKYLSALFLIVVAVIVAVSLTAKSDVESKFEKKPKPAPRWRYSLAWNEDISRQKSEEPTCKESLNVLDGWDTIFLPGFYACGRRYGWLNCWRYTLPIIEIDIGRSAYFKGTFNVKEFDSISIGRDHFCGLKKGELYCQAINNTEHFGTKTKLSESEPVKVSEFKNWQKVVADSNYSCGIREGTLYCWGSYKYGISLIKNGFLSTPTKIGYFKNIEDVYVGSDKTCVVVKGELYCWENIDQNVLSNYYDNIRNWKKVVLGLLFDCGITKDNKLYCWGWRSGYSPHGAEDRTYSSVPERVVIKDENEKWEDISLSLNGLCGIADGILYCWGDKIIEGNREVENSEKIVKSYKSSEPWESVIREGNNICAFKKGEVYCWGRDSGRLYSCDRAGGMKEPEFEKITDIH